ncbi:MAG: hypothetical protein H0X34_05700 [Chthoniobacterales bacterium]|nr:hypothetical protein [Chthoniobacterales bacterium]
MHLRSDEKHLPLRWLLAVFFVVPIGFARGASPRVVPIEIKDAKLAGAGADIIGGELPNAQFFVSRD